MTEEEIKKYLALSSRSSVCVFRNPIENAAQIIQSIYFLGKPEACTISFEFDPIDMVDEGEGWVYRASDLPLDTAIEILERHFGYRISDWENVTKTGRLDKGSADQDSYQRDELFFRESLQLGASLLPTGLDWE